MSDLPEWAQSLPTELHDAPHLKGSESADKWLGQLKTDSAWRAQSIRVPSEGADESVMTDFHEQLRQKVPSLMPTPMDAESRKAALMQMGMPEEPAGYQVPEGVELSNADEYKAAAHALNMTQDMFANYVQMEVSGRADQAAAITDAIENGYNDLRAEWGAAFDANYRRAGDVLSDAPDSIKEAYKNNAIPADQIKWLHSLAELADESQEMNEQRGKPPMTPEQASLELEDFKPTFYSMKRHDPGYKAAQAKFERLMRLRMGEVA